MISDHTDMELVEPPMLIIELISEMDDSEIPMEAQNVLRMLLGFSW